MKKTIGLISLFVIVALFFYSLSALFVMFAWNISVHHIFNLPAVNFFEALGLTIIISMLGAWRVKS